MACLNAYLRSLELYNDCRKAEPRLPLNFYQKYTLQMLLLAGQIDKSFPDFIALVLNLFSLSLPS
jgi:hypothetical protein